MAMLLGLTATGFQPGPAPENGVPAAPAPASPTVEVCRQREEAAARAPSADTHFEGAICFHDLASTTPLDGRLPLLERALYHFEQALTFEQREERIAVIQQRLGQIELALDELEARPREPDPVPVYGVPYPGRAGCGCETAPTSASSSYGFGALAVALLALRRRRR